MSWFNTLPRKLLSGSNWTSGTWASQSKMPRRSKHRTNWANASDSWLTVATIHLRLISYIAATPQNTRCSSNCGKHQATQPLNCQHTSATLRYPQESTIWNTCPLSVNVRPFTETPPCHSDAFRKLFFCFPSVWHAKHARASRVHPCLQSFVETTTAQTPNLLEAVDGRLLFHQGHWGHWEMDGKK